MRGERARQGFEELLDAARAAERRGDVAAARHALVVALGDTLSGEREHAGAARRLVALLERSEPRGALAAAWYLEDEGLEGELLDRVPAVDRARTLSAWGDRRRIGGEGRSRQERASPAADEGAARGRYGKASAAFEGCGLLAHAAIAGERAGEPARAHALWSRLAERFVDGEPDRYPAALAWFNVARTSRAAGDDGRSREAVVTAVRLLEEAADRFETLGFRERAFDCFHVLIALGRELGELEHLLEGYVNAIRILSEDHLRHQAVQGYEDAIAAVRARGEPAAAASLARELAAYARKHGLQAVANHAALLAGELWCEAAAAARARGAPTEIAENALRAAALALGEAGQLARVRDVYRELADLALEEGRRAHYERAARRHLGKRDLALDAAPLAASLRVAAIAPEVWHDDLVEWEQRGSAAMVTADVLLDPRASEATRRRALRARLGALVVEGQGGGTPAARSELAAQLGAVEVYAVLAPLEALLADDEAQVRVGAVRALGRLSFKRTLLPLRRALADSDADVREEAARAVERMHFPHALDLLSRLHRESSDPAARLAALRAIAAVEAEEAHEICLTALEHGAPDERRLVEEALSDGAHRALARYAAGRLGAAGPRAGAPSSTRPVRGGRAVDP